MMGLGVCCRLRNEGLGQLALLCTARVGQDRRLSDAMALAVAHGQDSHDVWRAGSYGSRFSRLVFPVAECT